MRSVTASPSTANRIDHPGGGYAYAPGISPYSAGVRALTGHRIRRVQLREPLSWRDGFAVVDRVLAEAGRPSQALCSVELRCPEPHSFGGFGSFNDDYRTALADRGVLLEGGVNPVARTNVAPAEPPADTELFGFGFTVPTEADDRSDDRPSFVVSGAGDLHDQADLRPEAIVGGDRPWAESGPARASVVLDEIAGRMAALGVGWADTDTVVAYTAEDLSLVIRPVLDRVGPAAGRGVLWHLARPPIAGLLFEMDARGGVDETSH